MQPCARIPGYYDGREDCHFMTHVDEEIRAAQGTDQGLQVDEEIAKEPHWSVPRDVRSHLADSSDAIVIASLIASHFRFYPSPCGAPSHVARQIRSGTLFRVIRRGAWIDACASARRSPETGVAEIGELTRYTRADDGLLKVLVRDLLIDLSELGCSTVLGRCRARDPITNMAFKGTGFGCCGRLPYSTRIGERIEDMNIWSRKLPETHG